MQLDGPDYSFWGMFFSEIWSDFTTEPLIRIDFRGLCVVLSRGDFCLLFLLERCFFLELECNPLSLSVL